MKSASIALEKILIPDDVERPASRVDDDLLLKSIQQGGIQQPLVVVEIDGKPVLIDGLRRIRAAHAIGLARVPVVIDVVPAGMDVDEYRRRIRFILDEHRQDLLPSQKAELIETLKRMFGFNHKQVSAYLGIDPDSVTNWLSVLEYIPPVVALMDSGALTMQRARVFDGLSEEGQRAILRSHQRELTTPGSPNLHKELRVKYPPETFAGYYRNPELTASRLARNSGKRAVKARHPVISAGEKKKLLNSVELKETELRDAQAELKTLKAEIAAAAPIVAAIMRNEKLLALVPEEVFNELSRFSEIY